MSDVIDKNKMLLDQILNTEENLMAAYECYKVFPQVIEQLIRRRKAIVQDTIKEQGLQGFTCNTEVEFWETYTNLLTCSSPSLDQVNLTLAVQTQATSLRNVIIGVFWKNDLTNESPELAQQIFEFFNDQFRSGRQSPRWPWYVPLRDHWRDWGNPAAVRALYNNELTEPENDMLWLCKLFSDFFNMM